MSNSLDVSIEAVVLVSFIVNFTDGAVGFVEGVIALHLVTVTFFVLGVLVAGVVVRNSIFEVVLRMGLKRSESNYKHNKNHGLFKRLNHCFGVENLYIT